ncbi:MAG: hypothetical protein DMG11_10175 [Acidobacteria bacterium]|nr:MAG: hypothetical protein DMG11_10175 [Acidobacteriota bacterium]
MSRPVSVFSAITLHLGSSLLYTSSKASASLITKSLFVIACGPLIKIVGASARIYPAESFTNF